MLILISDAFDAALPEKLSRFGEVTDDKSRLPEAEVVLVRSKTKCTKEYIDQAKKLKLIIRGGVGIDNIDKDYAQSKGIVVRNTPKASSVAVAELAMAHMIAASSHLIEYHVGMKEGKWLKKSIKRTELFGKKLCLVGLGHIAQQVAIRAKAFGMDVVAYDKYVPASDLATLMPTLEEAVADADYISIHIPLTDETKGMFNDKLFQSFKKSPIIVNTCRGLVVDADAMAKALEDGKVSLYCTDVYPSDPPAETYPLLSSDKVILTPHVGANSKENLLRIGAEAISIIEESVKEGVI
ncbi:MAG: NAD(P)-binding domain-containing protein [Spirochaetia bacterium]|jgi:D-3-phosphoglycerate dehydrogenase|nr:NAD(P)-binding domain-containing protein [Spirochaetia bacterium]